MVFLVHPIARITEISLHYSYKLPVIELLKSKRMVELDLSNNPLFALL